MDSRNWRLGIDIGGTFTDLTMLQPDSGQIITLKTPTVPHDPAQGIVNGLELLKKQGISPADIGYFVHGTTIGLNTLLQRKGAKIALLVTEGFRDILNLQRLRLPIPYDFRSRLPEPLVPRERVFTAEERLLHDGTVHTELNEERLRETFDQIQKSGATGVVICFLHSYKNPIHEQRAAELLTEWSHGQLDVSSSSHLWPQMREYERAVMTSVNLYIRSNVHRYFNTLQERLDEEGVTSTPFITQSNGGIMDIRSAAEAPVRTLFSGPAAGVIGAVEAARSAAIRNVITFDMGGTSADISIIKESQPTFSQSNHLAGLPIPLPAVSMYSVGAGGGSYGWIDNGGLLKVGPESVGSDPGPACYGKGTLVALTDAFLVCGYLNSERFAAGHVQLYADHSLTALEPIATYLGTDARHAADQMIQVAIANMYAELSAVMEQHGFDPRDFSLLAFGGGGPVTANFLADEIQARSVLIPPNPGTLCALGALTADFAYDAVLSLQRLAIDVPFAELSGYYAELGDTATKWLNAQKAEGIEGHTIFYTLDARYKGQAFEIELPVATELLNDVDYTRLEANFHDLHQRQYGHSDLNARLELINLRARIVGHVRKPELPRIEVANSQAVAAGSRSILIRGQEYEASIYTRHTLLAGHVIQGPAVVEQDDTTIVVLPDWYGRTDQAGNLILEKEVNL